MIDSFLLKRDFARSDARSVAAALRGLDTGRVSVGEFYAQYDRVLAGECTPLARPARVGPESARPFFSARLREAAVGFMAFWVLCVAVLAWAYA